MLRNKWFALPLVLLAFAMFANAGPFTIDVYATLGPSALGASYNAFVDNVVAAMQTNPLLPQGTGAAAYNPISTSSGIVGTIAPNQPIESTFTSWQGTAPGPYVGEVGTDLYFALHIVAATDATFSLSQLSWYGTSPSAPDDLYTYGPPNAYENDRRGYIGGVLTYGSGEDGTGLVDELIYVGVSNFYSVPSPSPTGGDQTDLNYVRDGLAAFAGQYITGKYTLAFATGAPSISAQADVQFEGVPEPGTIALAAMGLAAMLFARRKR